MGATIQPISIGTSQKNNANRHGAFDLLFNLQPIHCEWLLNESQELELSAGTVLIQEGLPIEHFYILIEGIMSVYHPETPDKPIGIVGPGQVIGEMSFIEQLPASACVKASERCMLVMVSFTKVEEKMAIDPSFQADFNAAILQILSVRLRLLTGKLNALQYTDQSTSASASRYQSLMQALEGFKTAVFKTREAETKRQEAQFQANARQTAACYSQIIQELELHLGDNAPGTQQEKDALGYKIQQEMAPYILMTDFLNRSYTKPRGYAGDFLTIANAYNDLAIGNGRTGELLDRLTLDSPAVKAVKNRRKLLTEEILNTIAAANGAPVHITVFACGPARELFDVYAQLEDPSLLKTTLIDIDLQALSYVSDRKDAFRVPLPMELHRENLIYLALGRRKIVLPPQDLIYSIGLIDYFNDQLVTKLSNYAHQLLKPGGRVIFGNFHPQNPQKAFMDHIIDWKLIHRTEADMDNLFQNSAFDKPCESIRFEEEQVNLFAICRK
jgi:extracellular factor (EF) 3-hydroxypalmitic acid methyl ester biosynthesis protein